MRSCLIEDLLACTGRSSELACDASNHIREEHTAWLSLDARLRACRASHRTIQQLFVASAITFLARASRHDHANSTPCILNGLGT